MSMRLSFPSLFYCSLFIAFVFGACRNEPKLLDKPIENTVKVRTSGDPENLNFLLATDANATEIFRLLSLPFANFDPSTYQLAPTLIKNLPITEEITEGDYKGTVAYDFEILEEAVWDNGTPITADDVLFTMKAVFNPNYASPHRFFINFVKHFEIDEENPKKFRIYGGKYLLAGPAISNFEAMPKYVYDPDGLLDEFTLAELQDRNNAEKLRQDEKLKKFADQFQSPLHLNDPKGISYSGPYKVESWTTGQEIVLVKKKNWWGDKLVDKYPLLQAHPNKIVYKIVRDINAAISLAKNGELDVISKIPWSTFMPLKEDQLINDKFNFYTPKTIIYRYIAFNGIDARFEDKRVRKALNHLFNRDQIYENVYYGIKNPIVGPIHPTKSYYHKDLKIREFNVGKAKALFKEAGWEDSNGNGIIDKMVDGERVEMDFELIYGNGYEDFANMAAIYKDDALSAGVNIQPRTMDSQSYFKALKSKSFDAIFGVSQWYPLNRDLTSIFSTTGSQNYSSFSSTEADELIKEIRFTADEGKLPALYKRVQEIIHEEAPCIFINTANDRIIINNQFKNVRVAGVKPHFYINEMVVGSKIPATLNNN